MKVGVYVDGYNLYYGGAKQLGKTVGWRWLDIRALVESLVQAQRGWPDAVVDHIVYCTACIDQGFNRRGTSNRTSTYVPCGRPAASTSSNSAST